MRIKRHDMKTRAEFDAGLDEAIELTRRLKREQAEGRFVADLTVDEKMPTDHTIGEAQTRLRAMDRSEQRKHVKVDELPFPEDM